MRYFILLILLCLCMSCARSTDHIASVEKFQPEKYMGKWYEYARLPHFFEKDLDSVYAIYQLKENGEISVLNVGYKNGVMQSIEGTATWEKPHAELSVSFFWTVSSPYRVIQLDSDYTLAMVTSSTMNYFWILSRTVEVDPEKAQNYIQYAKSLGFEIEKLQYPQKSL